MLIRRVDEEVLKLFEHEDFIDKLINKFKDFIKSLFQRV
jgi:hypothetical protein